MSVGFGYFHFQGAMPSFQFCKMRFYGHQEVSLARLRAPASEAGSCQPNRVPDRILPPRATVKDVLGYRKAAGLQALPSVRLTSLPRMADFAIWATACETAAGTFARAYMMRTAKPRFRSACRRGQ